MTTFKKRSYGGLAGRPQEIMWKIVGDDKISEGRETLHLLQHSFSYTTDS